MIRINVEDATRNFQRYLERVEAGETIIIMRRGKAVAEIKPREPEPERTLRPAGLHAGEFVVPDDFDAPLPDRAFPKSSFAQRPDRWAAKVSLTGKLVEAAHLSGLRARRDFGKALPAGRDT